MIFIGTQHKLHEIPFDKNKPDIHFEKVSGEYTPICKMFANPYVYYVGTSRGCSCDFSIKMNKINRTSIDQIPPIQNFLNKFRKLRGTFDDWKRKHEEKVNLFMTEQNAYLEQTRQLINIIRKLTHLGYPVELYCIWSGEYNQQPEVHQIVETSITSLEENFEIDEREFITFK